jgi:hypothetical protein
VRFHLSAVMGPKPAPASHRFWRFVAVGDGCWMWLGATTSGGYGNFAEFPSRLRIGNGNVPAHVFAYRALVGPVPAGMVLDHLCHNADAACLGGSACPHRRCVNPEHLEPATRRTNTLRGVGPAALHAKAETCPRGHPYDAGNTYYHRGSRHCRTCMWARRARLRAEALRT